MSSLPFFFALFTDYGAVKRNKRRGGSWEQSCDLEGFPVSPLLQAAVSKNTCLLQFVQFDGDPRGLWCEMTRFTREIEEGKKRKKKKGVRRGNTEGQPRGTGLCRLWWLLLFLFPHIHFLISSYYPQHNVNNSLQGPVPPICLIIVFTPYVVQV